MKGAFNIYCYANITCSTEKTNKQRKTTVRQQNRFSKLGSITSLTRTTIFTQRNLGCMISDIQITKREKLELL